MLLLEKYSLSSKLVYFWLLTILAVSLPFFSWIGSICIGLLLINWILESNWRSKFLKIKLHKSLLVFISIFFLYLIWFPINSDFKLAWKDVLMKLPVLVLPIIIGTSEPLDASKIRLMLRFFIGSVVFATIYSLAVYNKLIFYQIHDVREISIFIPHFQLSILIIIAILTILHWIKSEGRSVGKHHLLYVLIIIWLVFFLFLIKSLAGVTILGITMFILILILLNTIENQFLKVWLIIVMYAIPFFSIVTLLNAYNSYHEKRDGDLSKLELYTNNGSMYYHDTISKQVENGHRINIYISENELQKEWHRRSYLNYFGNDYKNQPLQHTLKRYMTSKGLRKDSAGIWQLTAKDIANIEKGMTNYIFEKNWSIYPRIYETIWEIHNYRQTGTADNKTFVQRIFNTDMGFYYFKTHPFLGNGNSNIPALIDDYCKEKNMKNIQSNGLIHNQYLRMLMAFGIIGLVIFLLALILPPFLERRWSSYYFLMIFLIITMSFFNDDILESHVGVICLSLFYSLFLWGSPRRLL